jgi:hypothetical protein
MRENFPIHIEKSNGGDFYEPMKLIREIFCRIPRHWQKVIPCETMVVVTDRKLYTFDQFNEAKIARLAGLGIDIVQVSLIGRKIYANYNGILKDSQKIFQYEALVMFAYAMCADANFFHQLCKIFPEENRDSLFANTLPLFLFTKSHAKLELEKPILFRKMNRLEQAVKMMADMAR